ncbi:MAG TPA: hydantoinase B/oxoprolinase family protein [Saprospiraceae bacterium]|nr:hydantoinase B/oxoprolinase family protein [Saprospiraceae bacterium]HMP25688.1 hydantoinase B/oxoprolinase family protein [Saprospiraceae bacterium]
MNAAKWEIRIDTGGTFTDCIAVSPEGIAQRIKVLSNSALRGRLLGAITPQQFRFSQQWRIATDIFQGYEFLLPGQTEVLARVVSIDFQQNLLTLDRAVQLPTGADFEITAREEAPVLAARIVTQTPLNQSLPPMSMRLGSTKGTNALLEKKGAKVAFLVTKGFRDLVYIGMQQRPHLFQLNIPEPNLLYEQVLEVAERLDAEGTILRPLTEAEIERIVAALQIIQPEAVAISLLHAYRNSVHEQQLATALARAGFGFVSCSHRLAPAIKIVPRAQTTLVNAYLSPVIHQYLQRIQEKLGAQSTLLVMTSAGGLSAATDFQPKDSLLSGPAGGVVGAGRIARTLGFERVLTFDMGGTSTDAARIAESYDYRFVTKVGDAEMLSPSLAIETVAAGGGSICSFDGHKLCVGPESAGAHPGPACYGAGGPLTITDVNLLLGKLEPSAMGIPVHIELARAALRQLQKEIQQQTGTPYSQIELLRGFEQIANEKMSGAIRKISVANGFDPRDYALLAFGGAGGLHACKIAEQLEIDTLILPYDGGLLSAYGIGYARIERLVARQVLAPLSNCALQLRRMLHQLIEQGRTALEEMGHAPETLEVVHRLVYLRFQGQESTLEIPFRAAEQLLDDFGTQYRQLFGHFPEGQTIEVESLRVIVGVRSMPLPAPVVAPPIFLAEADKKQGNTSIFYWEKLSEGAQIVGPAIILNPNSTAYVEAGWLATVRQDQNIVVERQTLNDPLTENLKEAVELELFTNRFAAIATEMGAQLQRTAFSVNVKERLDFSCALLDASAALLVNAPHIPVHLGSLGICARLVESAIPLGPGDVVITNHPKYGGSHLPDVTLLSAVYTPDNERIGYVVNRAHHAEIGGKRPGSMPPDARSLVEEGVVIPPMYLVQNGVLQWAAVEHLLQTAPFPTRALAENLADIKAALAALRVGEAALRALVQEHGLSKVDYYMNKLKQTAENALNEVLKHFDNQSFKAEEALDDGHTIRVHIRIENGRITFDFTGTSAVHPGNLNANISIVYSAVLYVLRLWCARDIPLNEGLMKNVQIELPTSFLHPDFSYNDEENPAVVGGNTEVSQRLVDTLLKALGLAACSQGTMNNFLFGNERFGYYETIGGGTGAGPQWRGRSAVHQHMTNTRITDPEELERRYPVRLWQFAVRPHSGGAGQQRGGDGIIRTIEFLEPLEMTLLSQHRQVAPYGIHGGADGLCGKQTLITKDDKVLILNGIDSRTVQTGDRIIIETPGGGGWGAPEK